MPSKVCNEVLFWCAWCIHIWCIDLVSIIILYYIHNVHSYWEELLEIMIEIHATYNFFSCELSLVWNFCILSQDKKLLYERPNDTSAHWYPADCSAAWTVMWHNSFSKSLFYKSNAHPYNGAMRLPSNKPQFSGSWHCPSFTSNFSYHRQLDGSGGFYIYVKRPSYSWIRNGQWTKRF